jgi:hypothetical protein
MGQAIGGSLPLAVGIALSPIPIVAVVLMLTAAAPPDEAPTSGRPSSGPLDLPATMLTWLGSSKGLDHAYRIGSSRRPG